MSEIGQWYTEQYCKLCRDIILLEGDGLVILQIFLQCCNYDIMGSLQNMITRDKTMLLEHKQCSGARKTQR